MYKRKDAYYKRAKKEGYPSRAVYKLMELSEKYRVLGRGNRIIDLGCSPGGWSRVACDIVGPGGMVVGVDLQEVRGIQAENFLFVRGDIRDEETVRKTLDIVKGTCDVVLSDLSPRLTGIRPRDDAATLDLLTACLAFVGRVLGHGGHVIVKFFPSEGLDPLIKEFRERFRQSVVTKPEASRRASSELYLIGKGFTG